MKFRTTIHISKPTDWELVASDVLDDFLEDFPQREGLTREVTEDDLEEFGDQPVSFIYTRKGMQLYERMVKRLDKLGNCIFPGVNFSYSPGKISVN